jgi:hypothetical protein
VHRDADDHQPDAEQVLAGRELAKDERADDGSEHREQGKHEREAGAWERGHGQLIGHVRDDRRAHADPRRRQQQHGMAEGAQGAAQPGRSHHHGGDEHRGGQQIDPAHRRGRGGAGAGGPGPGDPAPGAPEPGGPWPGDPVPQDHVAHEQDAVAEGIKEPQRLAGQADVGNGGHADGGEGQGEDVAPAAGRGRGQQHRAEEFDRTHRGQRKPGQRQVEQRVHRGEHHPELDEHGPLRPVEPGNEPPWAAPDGEDHGGARDAQPGHPEHRDAEEQQHGQRRPEIMKNRTDQEER